jgi:hypothetical protein
MPMNTEMVNQIVVYVGVPTIAGSLIFIGSKLQSLSAIEISMGVMKHNMKVVGDYLTKNHTKFNPSELKTFSPLRLTEAGESLIKKIGFDAIFEQNKSKFFTFIDNESPRLKYDIEVSSIKSIHAFADEQFMNPLKVYFYNNPERTMANTSPTLGVYIRDSYLAAHPEIAE